MKKVILCLVLSMFLFGHSYAADNVVNSAGNQPSSDPSQQDVKLKRKVAIARFSNETQSGVSFLTNNSGDRIGKQASDILSARLTDTGYFLMFERIDSNKISSEQMLTSLKESGVSVDYLIVGSVSEFGRSTESDTGVFFTVKGSKSLC
jgi:curli biogenesis system outer membrane secretion channel CsgG